jgi:hypothetical protein
MGRTSFISRRAFHTLMWIFGPIDGLKALKLLLSLLPSEIWRNKSRYAKNEYFLPVMVRKVVPVG